MVAATKAQLAHRRAIHAQAIAASSDAPTGLHPLMNSILRGQLGAQVATAEALRAANAVRSINAGETSPPEA